MHFTLLKHLFPTIKECRVSSLNTEIEQGFIDKAHELTDSLYEALSLAADQAWRRFERDSSELEDVLRPLHVTLRIPIGADE